MPDLNLAPRPALLEGARKLSAAVGSTAGPSGRLVAIGRTHGWTKDGVSVARNVVLPDPLEALGAAALQQAAQRQVEAVGDGTTQVVVIGEALARELCAAGLDPQRLMRAVEERVPQLEASIKGAAREATDSDVVRVILTATNHDTGLASMVSSALDVAKMDGTIVVVAGEDDAVGTAQGFEIARAPVDTRFPPGDLVNPLVFVSAERLATLDDVKGPLNVAKAAQRPLLIVAEAFDQQALTIIVGNAQRLGMTVMCLRAPGHTGSERRAILEDIAVACGARCIASDQGDTRATFDGEKDLGGAEVAKVGREATRLVMPHGKPEAIEARAALVAPVSAERAANLRGRSAAIFLRPTTPADEQERRDRIDDALQAARAAMKGGTLPGGGAVYVRASVLLSPDVHDEFDVAACRALRRALEAPLRAIVANAGLSPDVAVNATIEAIDGMPAALVPGHVLIFDVESGHLVSAYERGIIDPALVPLNALREAVTAARMLVLTSSAVLP